MPPLEVISDARIPIKLWIPSADIEIDAIKQLRNAANLPITYRHIAVMPDVHFGRGATVGTVMVTKDAICPAAVGVDIGCGMMAVQTDLDPDKVTAKLDEIVHSIRRSIPVGFHENRELTVQVEDWMEKDTSCGMLTTFSRNKGLYEKACHQMGSLGGGNHFIEICLDKDRRVWVMLHSGSRHIGLRMATYHTKVAQALMKRYHISLPDPELAYLPQGETEFNDYWAELRWAQEYAMANRAEMMRRVMKDLSYAVHDKKHIERGFFVNCHHNYAARENHFGENVIVVRKGAIKAGESDYGIVPGSMGAKSYIVQGLGDPQSFMSCAHGAGRKMSRKRAKSEFTVDDLKVQTEGIVCAKDESVLDEIPAAYKDIDTVMKNQHDLVKPVYVLRQIACIKGGKD
jgi:tRNA-splicing ligase RtcB